MFLFDDFNAPDFYPNIEVSTLEDPTTATTTIDNRKRSNSNSSNRLMEHENRDNDVSIEQDNSIEKQPEQQQEEEENDEVDMDTEDVQESLEKIAKVVDTVNTIQIELDRLKETKEKIIQRMVVERLGYKFPNELQINLAAGVYRNKIGTYVSQLCQCFEKLDGILSYGNTKVVQNRKNGVKRVEQVLKQGDDMFNAAKKLVKFANRLQNAPKYQKPITTSVSKTDSNDEQQQKSPMKKQKKPEPKYSPVMTHGKKESSTSPSPHTSNTTNSRINHHSTIESTNTTTPTTTNFFRRKSFKLPKYEIVNEEDQVEIRMILPKGCDPDSDLKFRLRDSSVLVIEGFEKPLEFAIDPSKMDIRGTTYRSKNGILRIEIPRRIIRPFARYQHPFSIW